MLINTSTMYNNLIIANRINAYSRYLEKSTERLSTGKAVNSAADSPADIVRISRMSSQIRGTHAAQRNIQDAMSLLQIMESSFTQMHEMGLRLKELSVQYSNSSLSNSEKDIIKAEAADLVEEIGVIMENTSFGGINVFDKDEYAFQIGNSINEKMIINNPLSSKDTSTGRLSSTFSIASTSSQTREIISKTYDIAMKLPTGQVLPGEIKLNLKDVEADKDIDFTIDTGGTEPSKGKLNFIDDDTARFELHVKNGSYFGHSFNVKLTGTIELGENASKTDLAGEGTYTFDEGFGCFSGKITFTLKSQEEGPNPPDDPPDDPPYDPGSHGPIDFEDIGEIPIETILRGDFVDKNILDPLASSRAYIGIKQNLLEYSLNRQVETETIMTGALSKIEDADMAKELIAKVKYDLLLQTNIQLLSQNLDDQRGYILGLLNISNY